MLVSVSRDLPAVETITVNMYREADKKKKKDRNALVCEYKYKSRQWHTLITHLDRGGSGRPERVELEIGACLYQNVVA